MPMRPIRYFSLDEANRTLAQVAPLLARLKELHASGIPLKERLDILWQRLETGNRVLDEIGARQQDLDAQAQEVAEILRRLDEIGCVVRDPQTGLVDFPAQFRGTGYFLCWRLGEDAVHYWHGAQEGFAGRKPLSTMPGHLIH
ncbi:MAG: DUF2203 family protein [Bacillati bacterium ANGP1]|uniref:DUF2203 family protein n=1 Tax=Candidatus Segetimicrobium genomatis TaxID=2569760 RepID=A0A537KZ31_9BACT|nr:MAG: DUF2203 family protein [Terrabacteria group bacterium ANGP1]